MNTTEEQKKKGIFTVLGDRFGKLPRWGKVLSVLGVLVVVLAVAGFAYVNGKLDLLRYSDGTIDGIGTIDADEDQDLDGTGLVHNNGEMEMPEGSPFSDEDVLNILLIGTDERTEAVNDADAFTHLNQLDGTEDTTEFSEDARADTLILVSLNIRDHTIRLVSIERGTGVPILLDGYEGEYDWITHTFRYGGAKLAMDTVEDCFNVQVDHYVRVNFNSFVQIVDAVGGVDIEITELEAKALNWEVPSNSMLIVNKVEPGLNHFDGYTALQYARLRKIDNDWKRIERQRTVIKAVLDQVKNASVVELDNLLNTVLPLVQTNFTKSEITALLVQLPGFLGAEVEQMSMPLQGTYGVRTGMDNRLMYDPDWAVNIKALQDFLYNGKTAEEVIAATPETAAAATAETAEPAVDAWDREIDPTDQYFMQNLHSVDLEYPLSVSDFGSSDYQLFMVGQGGSRDADVQQAMVQYLAAQGVRTVALPCGAAAGILLDDYLQTGHTASLEQYLDTLPADGRVDQRDVWQSLYAVYPGALHVVGLGVDDTQAVTAHAMSVLLRSCYTYPEEEIIAAVEGMNSGNVRNAVYWFRAAMQQYPRQMQRYLGDGYTVALRLYQGLQSSVNTGAGEDLAAYDLRRAVEENPDTRMIVFADTDAVLRTGDSLADAMEQLLRENAEPAQETGDPQTAESAAAEAERPLVCSIAVAYGEWGYDGTYTPEEGDTRWNADTMAARLGEYATPGKDLLLALDGKDSPLTEGEALLQGSDTAPAGTVQKLLVLSTDNKVQRSTPESGTEAE
ncbi:LCP family protein [uncultured Subdoligranulum sp.]|uniref:LCP family protein n=1 Tax=uncultured Subdoligranulum sp. TaxID=512298 RepID=UPI002613BA9B|nr:LCP family protein [uncultured Subdoligranulum sp.]